MQDRLGSAMIEELKKQNNLQEERNQQLKKIAITLTKIYEGMG